MTEKPVLVVFSDDWGRHPSSCQHLVRELLSRHEILWIDTIGTRPVRFDAYTIRRGFGKIARWLTPPRSLKGDPLEPTVVKPMMWPSFRTSFARRFNRGLLSRRVAKELGGRNAVFLTTIPIVADLIGEVPAKRWVYYCVDDFSVWPGLDGATMLAMEAELVPKVDRIVAVSPRLQQRLQEVGKPSTLLTHGVDLDFWKNPARDPDTLAAAPRPIVLFWGLIDVRLNVDWIARLSETMSSGSIVLVGPVQNPDPRLAALDRVRLAGPSPFSELPNVAAAADVLIMPYADLPVTQAMQPLKFKEYLATGKAVVATTLPATEEWNDAADLAETADAFVAKVMLRLQSSVDSSQILARQRLAKESWSAKAHELERICFEDSP